MTKVQGRFTQGAVLLFNTNFDSSLFMNMWSVQYNWTVKKIALGTVNLASCECDRVKMFPLVTLAQNNKKTSASSDVFPYLSLEV